MRKSSREKKTDGKSPSCENAIWKFLRNPIIHILLITSVGIIVYSNTFKVPFVLDDHYVIAYNPIIKDLNYFIKPSTAQHFDKNLFEYPTFKKRYIGYLTFALNYKIQGLDVTGYHIVNLLIHISTALLVYYFILLSFRTPHMSSSSLKERSEHIAVIAALFFVAHPIQTQAVTYIWQRVACLASMFYLLSVTMYVKARLTYQSRSEENAVPVRGRAARSLLYYVPSLVFAMLAMKTKEIAFTLPVSIVLYEFMFFNGNLKKRVLYLIPLFCTILIIPLSLINIDKPFGELINTVGEVTRAQTDVSRFDYLFTEFRVIVTYIRLLFLPINQNLIYEYQIYRSFIDPNVFLSFIFLLSLLGVSILLMYRYRSKMTEVRLISYGIFWFFITLSVESSVMPIIDPIFEHRMYLPSIGVFTSLITILFLLMGRLKNKWWKTQKLSVAFLTVLLVVLSGTTYARNEVWRTDVGLWEDVVNKSPKSALAYYNLGNAYRDKGDLINAEKAWRGALEIKPSFTHALNALGNVYYLSGQLEEAKKYYLEALEADIKNGIAHYNLALILEKSNKLEEALRHYKLFIEYVSPEYTHLIPQVKQRIFQTPSYEY